jgi:hypothetical protein
MVEESLFSVPTCAVAATECDEEVWVFQTGVFLCLGVVVVRNHPAESAEHGTSQVALFAEGDAGDASIAVAIKVPKVVEAFLALGGGVLGSIAGVGDANSPVFDCLVDGCHHELTCSFALLPDGVGSG